MGKIFRRVGQVSAKGEIMVPIGVTCLGYVI
jgi:hypothetical protein